MADALLKIGGMGGTSSDELTATKNHVLQGYTAVTSDSDDEPISGTIPNRGNGMDTVEFVDAHWDSKFLARMEQGFYSQNGQWKPYVGIPYAVLANGIHLDVNKMLDTLTVAGVRGTIPVRGYRGPDCTDMFMYQPDGGYVIRIEEGYYHMGGNRQWKPYVIVSPALAKSAVNYHPEKTLSDTRTCEEQGQVKMINTQDNGYTINQANVFALDGSRGKLFMLLGHGNAYYYRPDGNPHVEVNASELGTATKETVLQWQTASSQYGIKFEGGIPRWICNTGDVISAVGNNGFAWDDTHANRGRGIVTRIPNAHYIQGANYVFLPSPNLYPHNIRAGVNINGITGTMPDYSTGRTVFNGATFDGTLLLGVANKDFFIGGDFYANNLHNNYRYSGVHSGGINLTLSTGIIPTRGRYIGCVTSQSTNLTPFNRIDIYWRFVGDVRGSAYTNFIAGIVTLSSLRRGGMSVGGSPKDGFVNSPVSANSGFPEITKQGKLELYAGGINEQCFLFFYASANVNNRDRDLLNGSIQITRIDFLN